jgi:hypothetical protein
MPSLRVRDQPERQVAALSDVPASELAADPDLARVETKGPAVRGAMLWFDEAKDYGFVLTEQGERVRVDRDGFVEKAAPVGRCAGLPVQLTVTERDGTRIAVDVSLVPEETHGRARRRSSTIRSRSH